MTWVYLCAFGFTGRARGALLALGAVGFGLLAGRDEHEPRAGSGDPTAPSPDRRPLRSSV